MDQGDVGPSDNNRNTKYYQLTRAGRRQLETDTASWRTLAHTVGRILDLASSPVATQRWVPRAWRVARA
jgi:DNA-binding PadR family transcriptional regulator